MTPPCVILVLGSGATVGGGFKVKYNGTLWTPPMDLNFFETPVVQGRFKEADYPASRYYWQGPSLETLWSRVDLYYKLCRSGVLSEAETYLRLVKLMDDKAKTDRAYWAKMEREDRRWRVPDMAYWELRALVRDVFQDMVPAQTPSPLFSLIEQLRSNKILNGIITFNYDLSVELLFFDSKGIPFYYPLLPGQDATGKLPLMKLHGSINWQTDSKSDPRIQVREPIIAVAQMDHGGDWYKQPELIGPNFFKQEINMDIQPDGDFRAPFYKKLWSLAWDRLKVASHLVFVGFSFPQTDFHAAALFRTAHLSGSGFRRVILCHLRDSNLRQTAEQVFWGNKMPKFTEFPAGLQNMADRVDELIPLLTS